MGAPFATERRLLAEDEISQVIRSHYPELEGLDREELVGLARWLRSQHGRLRDTLHERRRIHRGKAEPRGSATESAGERSMAEKKQVFARGLKRVNGRLGKLRAEEKRARASAALHGALARRQQATVHHPVGGETADGGMRPLPSTRRRGIVSGGRIGSVSQAGRDAQAARDSRG
jgi:hypothetical protein